MPGGIQDAAADLESIFAGRDVHSRWRTACVRQLPVCGHQTARRARMVGTICTSTLTSRTKSICWWVIRRTGRSSIMARCGTRTGRCMGRGKTTSCALNRRFSGMMMAACTSTPANAGTKKRRKGFLSRKNTCSKGVCCKVISGDNAEN